MDYSGIHMTKHLLTVAVLLAFIMGTATAQRQIYSTSSGEFIFSQANVENGGKAVPSILRFTCFLHTGEYWHLDFSDMLGMYTGIGVRNVGLITKGQNDPVTGVDKIKRRSYALGIPLAFKFGSFHNNFYLYAGGEYEWLFHYKEKHFIGDEKIKFTEWFSHRTNTFVPSVFVGLQFPKGLNLRVKYYLSDFMNRNYVDENGNMPYAQFSTRVYYLSLSFNLKTRKVKEKLTHRDTNFAMLQSSFH